MRQKRKLEENPEQILSLERYVVVNAVDVHWQDHLTEMEELRRSVGLRGYGQKDPLSEYKNEAFRAFEEMMIGMRSEVCTGLFRSSTNLAAFENMLSSLSVWPRQQGQTLEMQGLISLEEGRTVAGQHRRSLNLPRFQYLLLRKRPRLDEMTPVPVETVRNTKSAGAAVIVQ